MRISGSLGVFADFKAILKFVPLKSFHLSFLFIPVIRYLRQRFNCLEVSIFHEEDLKNMRLKVRELQRRESLDNACPTGW